MSLFPTEAALTIRAEDGSALTEENCGIWAFGFDGEIWLEDGAIHARTASALEHGQHMTIMVELEKGVLSPGRAVEDRFETVKARAFENSDYDGAAEEDLTLEDLLLIGGAIAGIAAFAALIAAAACGLKKRRMDRQMRSVDYFRDAPNNGDLNVTYVLGRGCGLCRDDSLMGAYLLRLISGGSLEPVGEDEDPERVSLRLVRPPVGGDLYDDAFYTVLEAAAGADGVLQAKELERYTDRNAKPLSRFMDSCVQTAERTLLQTGCLKGAVCGGRRDLSDMGTRQLNELLGLKRFLLDFSLIHERGVQETVIWQDYMIYALLLGIADRVAPQIERLYPDALPQIRRFTRCARYAGYYNGILYRAYESDQARQQASRSSGHGGRASFGGGGGFSGGGGGGVR